MIYDDDIKTVDRITNGIRVKFRHTEIFKIENTKINVTFSTGKITVLDTTINENLIVKIGISNTMAMFEKNSINLKGILLAVNEILHTDYGLSCGDTNLIAIKFI